MHRRLSGRGRSGNLIGRLNGSGMIRRDMTRRNGVRRNMHMPDMNVARHGVMGLRGGHKPWRGDQRDRHGQNLQGKPKQTHGGRLSHRFAA